MALAHKGVKISSTIKGRECTLSYSQKEQRLAGEIRALAGETGLERIIDKRATFDVCGNDPYTELARDITTRRFDYRSLEVAMKTLVATQGSSVDINDLRKAAEMLRNELVEIPRPYASN